MGSNTFIVLSQALTYLSYVLELAGGIIGLFIYRRLAIPWRLVHALVVLAFVAEISAKLIIALAPKPNTHWILNLYVLFEIPLLTIPALLLIHRRWTTYAGGVAMLVALIMWIYQASQQPLTQFFSDAYLAQCLLQTMLYLAVLINAAVSPDTTLRRSEAMLCIAMILYSGCTIPIFGIFHYLVQRQASYDILYPINNLLSVVRYGCLIAALLLLPRRHMPLPPRCLLYE